MTRVYLVKLRISEDIYRVFIFGITLPTVWSQWTKLCFGVLPTTILLKKARSRIATRVWDLKCNCAFVVQVPHYGIVQWNVVRKMPPGAMHLFFSRFVAGIEYWTQHIFMPKLRSVVEVNPKICKSVCLTVRNFVIVVPLTDRQIKVWVSPPIQWRPGSRIPFMKLVRSDYDRMPKERQETDTFLLFYYVFT
jgi:hypothetical protein